MPRVRTRVVTVGLLHPGAMGVTIGASCRDEVVWASSDRSPATRARAEAAGFRDVETVAAMVACTDLIVSVCPPESATGVAHEVADLGFAGTYVDANAIAPSTARAIGRRFASFVDGGIVGPPATQVGTTRLYLSGEAVGAVAERWEGPLDVRVLDGDAGAASALKMAYAMWTKVSAALLLDVRALAKAEGVEHALLGEWEQSQPGTSQRSEATASGVAPKAWRFAGEMDEMATAALDVGLPSGFAEAAAEIYRRLADMKDRDTVDLEDVVVRLVLGARPDENR